MRKEAVYYRKTDVKKFEDFKDGDIVCEVCNGWGYFYDCFDNRVSQCYHCRGMGKLDWITNVTGAVGISGTTGGAAIGSSGSSFHDMQWGYGTSSGCGRPPPPPKKRVVGRKALKQKSDKVHVRQSPTIKTVPYKAVKKIPLKERFMRVVADK